MLLTAPAAQAAQTRVPVGVEPTFGPVLVRGFPAYALGTASVFAHDPVTRAAADLGVPAAAAPELSDSRAAWVDGGTPVTVRIGEQAVPRPLFPSACSAGAQEVSLAGDQAAVVAGPAACSPAWRVLVGDAEGVAATVATSTAVGAEGEPPLRLARVAGPYAAWVDVSGQDDQAVVADRLSGVEVYRVPIVRPGRIVGLELQDDGAIVVSWLSLNGSPLTASARPTNPRPVLLAAGRTLALAGGRALVDTTGDAGTGLSLVELDGTTKVVKLIFRPDVRIGAADFDGHRLTYARRVAPTAAVKAVKRPCSRRQRRLKRCPKAIPGRPATPGGVEVDVVPAP